MLSTLGEYARIVEAVAARPATDPAAIRALDAAGSHAEQLGLLARELDTYWPPAADGARLPAGVPAPLLALAEDFRLLAARCAEYEAAIAEACHSMREQALAGLRSVRVTRMTEGRYYTLRHRAGGGLVDLER